MKHVSNNFKLLYVLLIVVLYCSPYMCCILLLYLWYLCGNIRVMFVAIHVAIALLYSWYCRGYICVMFVVICVVFVIVG